MTGFRMLRTRQLIALSVTLVLLVLLALLYRRPDLFGEFSKGAIDTAQIVLIMAFIAFSVFNWRCPACKKYLGSDISRRTCRRCGARLR
ncbi:MAG TPA: hypothetical protein VEI96_01025 [Thermodesulfovibrionales bacterium]|nr:hypothetical protein [Thermodesulfovibrionales bacterium]